MIRPFASNRPAPNEFADGAEPHHFQKFLAGGQSRRSAPARAGPICPIPTSPQIGLGRDGRRTLAIGIRSAAIWSRLAARNDIRNGSGMG